jgi:hypothetical protein
MNSSSKIALSIFATAWAIWDIITTFNGMSEITQSNVLGGVLTILINGAIIFCFITIDSEVVRFLFRFMIIVAISVDIYTAFNGSQALMTNSNMDNSGKTFISIGMTLISVASSIILSYIIFQVKSDGLDKLIK